MPLNHYIVWLLLSIQWNKRVYPHFSVSSPGQILQYYYNFDTSNTKDLIPTSDGECGEDSPPPPTVYHIIPLPQGRQILMITRGFFECLRKHKIMIRISFLLSPW